MDSQLKLVHLMMGLAGLFLTLTAAVWGMVQVHASAPHAGAVTTIEIALIREVLQAEHKFIRAELTRMNTEISTIKLEMKQ